MWLLVRDNEYGTDVELYDTERGARLGLANYCLRWWEQEGVVGYPSGDPVDIIAAYFEHIGNEGGYIADLSKVLINSECNEEEAFNTLLPSVISSMLELECPSDHPESFLDEANDVAQSQREARYSHNEVK